MLAHQVKYDVTALQRVLGIDQWIIISGGLEHTYEDGGILCRQVLWLAVEVGLAGGLDAKGVRTEINGIGILRQDLVLGKEELQLIGCNPLFALHDEHFYTGNVAKQSCGVLATGTEEVLGQLLGDGRSTTRIAVEYVLLQHSGKGCIVNAVM